MLLAHLLEKRAALVADLEAIQAGVVKETRTKLNDEEAKRHDAVMAEIAALDVDIERLKRARDAAASQTSPSADPVKPNPGTVPAEVRGNEAPFKSFGHQLQAIAQVTRGHGADLVELRNRLEACNRAALGQNEQVNVDGGFLVYPEFVAGIQKRLFEVGQLSSKVTWTPLTVGNQLVFNALKDDSRATGSRSGGVRVYMGNEADAATKAKVSLREMKVDLKKMVGLYYATEEILEDAPALQAQIAKGYEDEMSFSLDDQIIRGDGNMQLKGYLNSACKVTVSKETGQATGTILYQNILKMYSRSTLGPNVAWYANRDTLPQLAQMSLAVGTGGAPVWLPAGGASGKPYNTLMGLPLYFLEQCESLSTEGDIILLDPTDYVGVKKGGLRTDTSMHVQFLTGESVFRVMMRIGGQPFSDKPITPYKGSNTISPCVTLQTR